LNLGIDFVLCVAGMLRSAPAIFSREMVRLTRVMEMRNKIVEHFKFLTSIDSPSGREGELAEKLAAWLEKDKFDISRDSIGNLIARRGNGLPLLLCCHMDTVESSEGLKLQFKGDYITSSGDTILGADDKAGIAVLLATLECLDCYPAMEILFSVQEETGMKGTKALESGSCQAKWGLILDAAEPAGAIINQAPGETELDIIIHGRGSHAAAAPEKGIDAIRLAAKFIHDLPKPRIEDGSTFNLGVIKGGKSTNTICPRVQLLGEVRSYDDHRRKNISQRLETILADAIKGSGGGYEFETKDSYPSYHVSDDHDLIKLLEKTARPLKIPVNIHPRFAGSDANLINSMGIAAVNLGVGVEDGHSFQERVSISAMLTVAKWLKAVIKEWCNVQS